MDKIYIAATPKVGMTQPIIPEFLRQRRDRDLEREYRRQFEAVLDDIDRRGLENSDIVHPSRLEERKKVSDSVKHIIELIETNPYLSQFSKSWSINYLEGYVN